MQIFLIRHPQPDVAQGLCYGQTDLALVEELPLPTKQLQKQLPKNIPLFSSPLLRCRLLAEALGSELHAETIYDDRLKEMHFGEWEMRAWSSIPRQQLDSWAANPLHYAIPGGESVAQMQERVLHFIDEKQKSNIEHLVLITHAGVMKIFFAHVKKLPLNDWMNLHFDYGSLHQIEVSP